jgi:hypothetical protein
MRPFGVLSFAAAHTTAALALPAVAADAKFHPASYCRAVAAGVSVLVNGKLHEANLRTS